MTSSRSWMFQAREMIDKRGLYTIVDGDPYLLHKRLYKWVRRNNWIGYTFAQDKAGGVVIKRVK